ncbi:TldD/PmbA family protein [Pelagibius litoralis]|uniref:TldD/PmbA family protein n=1 Tax=Pelagibius litoralis TaxID=374515 RepID=A0A967F178_9PROT|nr:TldD/PmbA family protein [Pelagibius litoralis]NIA71199.1 TldD/PmbA family protein [Pelagibius litoralis]
MTASDDSLSLLEDLIRKAKASGADTADAVLFESISLSHAQRLGTPEKLEREESQDVGLRVMIGKRQAIVSSTDLGAASLDGLVERVVAMARAVPEDPYCGLADESDLAKTIPDLDILDPEEPPAALLIERARICEEAAMAVAGVTNSEGAEASWGRARIALVTSNGFAGTYGRSSHSMGVSVIAGEGLGMESDYEFSTAVYGSELEAPESVGRSAGERAVRRLGATKPQTEKLPIVYDPRVSNGLLRHLAGAISGPSIARGTSFLKDKLGERIFAEGITIVDDPHRPHGLSSKPFDAEGLANGKLNIIDGGVLTTWVLDLSSARQLGLKSTGHAARGTSSPPSPSTSNLYMAAGKVSPEALMADIDKGFYVTSMMGMGINGVTGDYSRGASGFRIENGKLGAPISEATVAGNLKDMFLNLTPADDLVFKYGANAPTLRIDGMTLAGA